MTEWIPGIKPITDRIKPYLMDNLIKVATWNQTKKLAYYISLGYTLSLNYWNPVKYSWMSQIDSNIFLGGLPIPYYNHIEQINSLGVKTVISCVETFELMVDTKTWNTLNIQHHILETPDYLPLTEEMYDKGIDIIKTNINNKIYIHCCKGVGRSVSLLICYLFYHGLTNNYKFKTLTEIINYIKLLRPQISISVKQFESIQNYCSQIIIN